MGSCWRRSASAWLSGWLKAAEPRASLAGSRPDDDKGWWRALVWRVLVACGPAPGEVVFDGLFEELYAHFAEPGVWALYPEAAAVLDALSGEYRLGVVSNWDRRLYPVLEQLGVRRYFDTIVISSETGVDKPDIRIFAAALSALGVAAAETVHAGDDPGQDWRAAEAAGLHVYRVERPARTLEPLPDYVRALQRRSIPA
jgi:putative hydrolase of the HAD superfamily